MLSRYRNLINPQESWEFSFNLNIENFSYLIVKTKSDKGLVFDWDFLRRL